MSGWAVSPLIFPTLLLLVSTPLVLAAFGAARPRLAAAPSFFCYLSLYWAVSARFVAGVFFIGERALYWSAAPLFEAGGASLS